MAKKRRETRIASITYSMIEDWTGLGRATLQGYAAAGKFDSSRVVSIMEWVNSYRAKKGLSQIGCSESPATNHRSKSAGVGPLPQAVPDSCGYDPRTGSY